jgi:hypothetical protein
MKKSIYIGRPTWPKTASGFMDHAAPTHLALGWFCTHITCHLLVFVNYHTTPLHFHGLHTDLQPSPTYLYEIFVFGVDLENNNITFIYFHCR